MYLVYLISDGNYRRIEFYLYQLHVSQKLQILSERKKLLKYDSFTESDILSTHNLIGRFKRMTL